MRRPLAISLILLFGWTLTAPLFATSSEADLPACCRRHGAHHCAMNGAMDASRSITSIAPKCPSFPKATTALLPHGFAPSSSRDTATALFVHPTTAPQTEARYRIAYCRSRQKRGPPIVIV